MNSTRGWNVLTFVVAAIAAAAMLSTPSLASTSTSTLLPELLASVPGSHLAYVVSVSSPACRGGSCVSLAQVDVTGSGSSKRTLPPLRTSSGSLLGNLESLTFATASSGYLTVTAGSGTELYVTTDGARSWHLRLRTGAYPYHAVYATPRRVYAITGTCSGMGVCRNQHLLSAPPSGTPWTSSTPPFAAVMAGMGLVTYGNDVWIQQPQPAVVLFLHSTDGGRTFSTWRTSALFNASTCYMTASSTRQIWARCSTGMNSLYLSSPDGARHWRVIDTHGLTSNTSGGYFDPVSDRLAFVDLGADAPAPKDDLLRLAPSGASTPVARLGCAIVNGLDFVDAHDGLVSCQRTGRTRSAVLLATSDGGRTWQPHRS